MSIRVLIVDDHEVVRNGLRALADGTDVDIIAEAESGEDGVRLACEQNPDLVLLDIRLTDGDGLNALSRMKTERP